MSTEDDQIDTNDTEQSTPEIEARARDMGWKPEAEWKGKPPRDGFLAAPEYVRRADKIMPIVRAENTKLKDELAKVRGELELTRTEQRQTIARIEKMSTLALTQQREQIEAGYAARKEAAVEVGDKEAYKQIVKDEKAATAALDERLKENEPDKDVDKGKKAQSLPKDVEETVEAWKADNRWYTDDPTDELTAYANARHMKLQKEKKGLSLKENLEQVAADVRKRFPEQFADATSADDDEPDAKPSRGSRVESGSRMNGGGGGSSWSKVPQDARKVATDAGHLEYFLKSGETMEKNLPQARERWAAKYLEGDAR